MSDQNTNSPDPPATRVGAIIAMAPAIPRIEVISGAAPRVVPLGDAPLLIGRADECGLRIDLEFVSARHLQIAPAGPGYAATDLGSTNASFLNGQVLTPGRPHPLVDADILYLSDPADPAAIRLVFYAGPTVPPTRTHPLGDASLSIGRAEADITLDHPLVSRRHAWIEPAAGGHRVIDRGSMNGTLVNGRPITRYTLRPGDTIQIASFRLVYRGDRLEEHNQRDAARLEARGLWLNTGPRGAERSILRDISLRVDPHELVAVIGASGAGKSSLLNVLSGMARPSQGLVETADIGAATGFVPQEETLHYALPVGRALTYRARLRLPPDTAPSEIERRVTCVLAEVGLIEWRDQPIGQLSGGQRRRAMIAAELLADPGLFFLDEPTAALDPGLERRMFLLLRGLADAGRSVVVATHAASSLNLCDRVVVLHEGRLVFFGRPDEATSFFGAAPGDFAAIYAALAEDVGQRPETGRPGDRETGRPGDRNSAFSLHPSSFAHQFRVLGARTAELVLRDRRNLAILLAQAPAIGLLLALVARADALVGERAAANEGKKVLFLLATVAVWFGVINAARTIAGERAVLRQERLTGLRIGPYLLAKWSVLGALVAVQALALLGLTLLKVRMPAAGVALPLPIELYLTTLLAGLAGLALGLLISAAGRTPDRAISLVPLAIIPQILFAGVIFSLGDGLTAQRALSWLTISRWAMDAFGASADLNSLPLMPGLLRPLEPAPEYLHTIGHLLSRWLTLAGCATGALGLTWLVLRGTRE